jgi:uncharacterized protein YqjF (DUF2071 family)
MTSLLDLLSAPSRQSSVLERKEHRPWPLPTRPWVMAQTWGDLLLAHWPVDAEVVRRLVPHGLTLDERNGSAWLGITPFEIGGLRLRGTWPLPGVSRFPELNVRTYVTAEEKPGIWFFSLDTSNRLAVEAARRLFRLPYKRLRLERSGGGIECYNARRGGERAHLQRLLRAGGRRLRARERVARVLPHAGWARFAVRGANVPPRRTTGRGDLAA